MNNADLYIRFNDSALDSKAQVLLDAYGNVKPGEEFSDFSGGWFVSGAGEDILPRDIKKEMTVFLKVRIDNEGWNNRTLLSYGNENQTTFRLYTYIPGVDQGSIRWDDLNQNYLSFPCEDNKLRALEGEITLCDKENRPRTLSIGVPAAVIGGDCWHDVVLRTNGIHFDMFVDGVLVDQEWTIGNIFYTEGSLYVGRSTKGTDPGFHGMIETAVLWYKALTDDEIAGFSGGFENVKKRELQILGKEHTGPLQYWTPRGHNAWVGDTSCYYYDGAYHLLYLIDRRHGESKFGGGGHQFAHISSKDLVTWDHHPLAVPIEEEWETIGTGNVLCEDGKCYLFYGMHSDRFVDQDSTMDGDMKDAELEDGTTQPLPFFHNGKFPIGSAIAKSDDGVQFKKEKTIVHRAQNPGIFKDKSAGLYYFLAGYGNDGVFYSKDMYEWKKSSNLIPFGPESALRNTSECQCLFEWNGWYYILAGRTGFWMSRNFLGPYWSNSDDKEVVVPRWDIYDGLWVPMVAEFKENRRILAGWLQGNTVGWAGHLVFRELVQLHDGTLGMKWPREMIPATGETMLDNGELCLSDKGFGWKAIGDMPESYYLKVNIQPSEDADTFGVCFIGSGDYEKGCELRFNSKKQRVQWGTPSKGEMAAEIPSFSEIIADSGPEADYSCNISSPHIHYRGLDFVIENVEGLDREIALEAIVRYDAKSRSSIIDVCINEQRTMITRRVFTGEKLFLFAKDGAVQFKRICIKALL